MAEKCIDTNNGRLCFNPDGAVFIFEGPDNSGKDTLIAALKKWIWENYKTPCIEIHPKYEKVLGPEVYKQYFRSECYQTLNLIRGNHVPVIFNRFYPSEYVYGQIYRDYILSYAETIENELLQNHRNIYNIFTYADAKILRTREDGLSLSAGALEKIEHELNLYKDFINNHSALDWMFIDTSDCDIEGSVNEMLSLFK